MIVTFWRHISLPYFYMGCKVIAIERRKKTLISYRLCSRITMRGWLITVVVVVVIASLWIFKQRIRIWHNSTKFQHAVSKSRKCFLFFFCIENVFFLIETEKKTTAKIDMVSKSRLNESESHAIKSILWSLNKILYPPETVKPILMSKTNVTLDSFICIVDIDIKSGLLIVIDFVHLHG